MIGIQGETALEEVTKSPADAALSTTSTNSVQNKVVTGEINKLNNDLTTRVKTSDIINNLTSTATDKPLSANMGKKLNNDLSDYVKIISVNKTNVSINANSNTDIRGFVDDVAGYKPIFMFYRNNNGSNLILPSAPSCPILTDNSYDIVIVNTTDSNFSDFTVRMSCLYIRDI